MGYAYANLEWANDTNSANMSDKDMKNLILHIKDAGYSGVMFDIYVDAAADGTLIKSFLKSGSYDRAIEMMKFASSIGLDIGFQNRFVKTNTPDPINPFNVTESFSGNVFLKNVEEYFAELSPLLNILGVKILIMGSDMQHLITSQYHGNWQSIVNSIKKTYSGIVTFEFSNDGKFLTDDVPERNSEYWFNKVGIWDLVDVIGLNLAQSLGDEPVYDIAEIVKEFHSNSAVNNNFANDFISLATKYDKKIYITGANAWNWDMSLNGKDSDLKLLIQNKYVYDPLLQSQLLQAKLNFIHQNLYDQIVGYTVMGYTPWVYQTFVNPTLTAAENLASNNRIVTQTLAGPTLEFNGTLAEKAIKEYLTSGLDYYQNVPVLGGSGDDKILTGNLNDVIFTGGGNDIVKTAKGNDAIHADLNNYVSIGIKNWFTNDTTPVVKFSVVINDQKVGEGTLEKNFSRGALFPDGYWSSPKLFEFSLQGISSANDVKVFISDGLGLMEINSIRFGESNIDMSTGLHFRGTQDKTSMYSPKWVANGDVTQFNLAKKPIGINGANRSTYDGGEGVDTVKFVVPKKDVTFKQLSDSSFELYASNNTFQITNIERLNFSDKSIAIDINGNAGATAKLLGAVFGKDSLSNKQYFGIGLSLLDAGMSTTTLASLAVDAANLKTNDQIVSTLWKNVFGTTASNSDKAPYVKLLDDGMSPGTLAWLAADTTFNKVNINLVGLAQTGIEYIPVS
jgi:hypothetical protein